ncbi:MAG: hypothetical protein FJ009_09830 [Chloroflexi bacterium]|nr:hypothetical protein [Chloroflexota bacterium]
MKRDNEILTPSQRWSGLATIAAMIVLLGFFAAHQLSHTGFFTDRFGSLEMLALYAPILISFAAPMVRAVTGRQNPARPFDAATNLSLAIGSLWLAIVFPFDFAHLTAVLPDAIRFIFGWITDDIGRFVLIAQVILGVIFAPLTMLTYFGRRASTM